MLLPLVRLYLAIPQAVSDDNLKLYLKRTDVKPTNLLKQRKLKSSGKLKKR